jgi:hypothetical protein
VGLTTLHPSTMSRLSRQCGIFNISQPYRPPRHVRGMALPFFSFYLYENRIFGKVDPFQSSGGLREKGPYSANWKALKVKRL